MDEARGQLAAASRRCAGGSWFGIERLALGVERWQYGLHTPVLPGVKVSILPLLSVLLASRFLPNAASMRGTINLARYMPQGVSAVVRARYQCQ
jgi:hypothetical protein